MAANYVPPDVVEKRTRFFDGQFLQDQDFVDEQNYHLDRQRRHSRLLHVSGVAEGLTVAVPGPNQVTVSPGTAIDSDGRQLALAQAATVDLPAERFNDKQGVELYAAYQQSAEDRQTGEGSADFTRWLERPELLAVPPGDSYEGSTPPVLLATLALDGAGRVTVDETSRSYSGVRLPGPAADAPVLRTAASGLVSLGGSLTVEGSVGIGTTNPAARLDIAGLADTAGPAALQLRNGNTAANFTSDQITLGYNNSAWYRHAIKTRHHAGQQAGNAIDFYVWNYSTQPGAADQAGGLHTMSLNGGSVGIGTTAPSARLSVVQPGATEIAGNAQSAVFRASAGALGNASGSEAVLSSIGLTVSNNMSLGVRAIRTANGSDWSSTAIGLGMDVDDTPRAGAALFLHANGNIGIGTASPAAKLHVSGGVAQLDGSHRLLFTDTDTSNNLKVQLWSGYGLGINPGTLFYAANGRHSWRDNSGANERMALTTAADGGLTVSGTGASTFAGTVGIGTTDPSIHRLYVNGGTVFMSDKLWANAGMAFNWMGQWKNVENNWQGLCAAIDTGAPSDDRLKTGFAPLRDALLTVLRLRGVRYRWSSAAVEHYTRNVEETMSAGPDATPEENARVWAAERARTTGELAGEHIGLVAQDVEAVVPELVYDDPDGYKRLRYGHLTALLVEAVKEQQSLIRALSDRIATIETGA